MTFHERLAQLSEDPAFVADAEFAGALPDEPSVEAIQRIVVVFRRMADRFERIVQEHQKESTP